MRVHAKGGRDGFDSSLTIVEHVLGIVEREHLT
jgi:hypothetical protein